MHAIETSEGEGFLSSDVAPENLNKSNNSHHSRPLSLKENDRFELRPRQLSCSVYILFITLGYAFLALFAWILTCVLTYRPIGVSTYGYQPNEYHIPFSGYSETTAWYKVSRVIRTIVATLTLPLTSAVCSRAAVLYTQNHGQRQRLSMRQSMVLADKGWTDPATWINLARGRSERYGSFFLFWAMGLVLLGGISNPLQEVFLTQKFRKMPTGQQYLPNVFEPPDFFKIESMWDDSNTLTILTRSSMTSTSLLEVQPRLWQSDPLLCINDTFSPNNPDPNKTCTAGGSSLANMVQLRDPFLAPLISNFSTGLIRQFSPRINSSSHITNIEFSDWPVGCSNRPGSFFTQYANVSGYKAWDITLCLPTNYSNPLIQNTRDRQDLSESLYINVSVDGMSGIGYHVSGLYRVDLDTTIGYFELPNYMNGQTVGPLLSEDPKSLCGQDCTPQGWQYTEIIPSRRRATDDSAVSIDTALRLESLANKPPLLSIAMALFGEGSYLAERMTHPASSFLYPQDLPNWTVPYDNWTTSPGACIGLFPWLPLTYQTTNEPSIQGVPTCLENSIYEDDELTLQIQGYLLSFIPGDNLVPVDRLENAFNAAAFLANQNWLVNNPNLQSGDFYVSFDLGEDVETPYISFVGVIVVSIVLVIYLSNLMGMAIYSCWYPRWTAVLDAYALMRIGASIHEHLVMAYTEDVDKIKVLDEVPGCVGDTAPEDLNVGQLGIGESETQGPLRRGRKYWAITTESLHR